MAKSRLDRAPKQYFRSFPWMRYFPVMAAPSKSAREASLQRIDAKTQKRLDYLMARSNEGELTDAEQTQLERFVVDLEALSIKNAKLLAQHARPARRQRKSSPPD